MFAEEKQPTLVTSQCLRCIFWRSSPPATFLCPQQHLFKCAVPRCWKKKEMTITGSGCGWLVAAARRVLHYTEKKLLLFMHSRQRAQQKAARRGEERITHTHTLHAEREYIHPACSFQRVLRFRCLAVKSHCVDQPGSSAK